MLSKCFGVLSHKIIKRRKVIKKFIKNIVRYVRQISPAHKARAKRILSEKEVHYRKVSKITKTLYPEEKYRVLNGPFKEMRYITSSNGSQLLPKLVGCYEEPITNWINEVCKKNFYSTIIDVGCAEGYYAVGFAVTNPNLKVLAYDIDPDALNNAKSLATLNNVSNKICFGNKFNATELERVVKKESDGKILVFMDVEGEELELLNPLYSPSILKVDIIVELHDCFQPGLTDQVIDYLVDSHSIELIYDYPWRRGQYDLNGVSFCQNDVEFIQDERRPSKMRWLFARTRHDQ